MQHPVYILSDNIVSPLGFSSEENFMQLRNGVSGVTLQENGRLSPEPVHAAVIDDARIDNQFAKISSSLNYTKFEKLVILSVHRTLELSTGIDPQDPRLVFVLSTTKGNIDLLEGSHPFPKERAVLTNAAAVISAFFGFVNTPVIISNACISGILAIIVARRLIAAGTYDHAVVSGADLMTPFVVSGFQSFKAISSEVAKPFDAGRDGISLGEAAATMILSHEPSSIEVTGGASSNDANHISGPSRTGDGLLLAIRNTLKEAGRDAGSIDYISGHGTATLYNDEMEALAINDAGLASVPMNSLKSYFGHTLGAAGLVESIIGIHSMREGILIGTYNYKTPGTSKPVNVLSSTTNQNISNCLKTAAGFGGCNAAVLFEKR